MVILLGTDHGGLLRLAVRRCMQWDALFDSLLMSVNHFPSKNEQNKG
ncbi:hypothetical protein APY03_0148 [Variovorax sp. WDL1]|nr:hypothetical protein APY03_0148 [Variovorax sp. WDL1]